MPTVVNMLINHLFAKTAWDLTNIGTNNFSRKTLLRVVSRHVSITIT